MGTETLNSYSDLGIILTAAGADNAPFTVTSAGTIKTTGNYGIYSGLPAPFLLNLGSIAAAADGVTFSAGGTVENSGDGALISGAFGVGFGGQAGTVINSGTIIGTQFAGISFAAGGSVANSGLITGATLARASSNGIDLDAGTLFLSGSGTVAGGGGYSGAVAAGYGGYGVSLGAGATLSNAGNTLQGGAGGKYTGTGTGYGGVGGIGALLAPGADLGNAREGTILGGAGGGATIDGGAGSLGVYAGAFATLINAGAISGGAGGAAAEFGGAGGGGVLLAPGAYLSNASTGIILGGAGGAETQNRSGYGGYGVYIGTHGTYYAGVPTLISAASLVNDGQITGGAGGYGGTIAGVSGGGQGGVGGVGVVLYLFGTFTNAGGISGGIGGGGALGGGSGGAGLASANGATLVNFGVIAGGAGGAGPAGGNAGQGVEGFENGLVINNNLITGGIGAATGTYAGAGGEGMFLQDATLINQATIAGGAGGAAAVSFSGVGGYGIVLFGGYIGNTGTIIGGAGGASAGGYSGAGGSGVALVGGTLTNSGSIAGGNGGSVGPGGTKPGKAGYGVDIQDGATLFNAGTISGGTAAGTLAAAVYFSPGANGELIVTPNAVFRGAVVAQYGSGDLLALATTPLSPPVTNTLAGFGTEFIGFDTLAFETGKAWLVAGDATAFDAATITGFLAGDTIDLAGISAATETFANGVLTLASDTGAVLASLQLNEPAGLEGVNYFALNPDGNGGTDITSDVQCFAAGTRILTPAGEVPVEALRVGDRVVTVRDGGMLTRRIVWTGQQRIHLARQPEPQLLRPVCIRAGALAAGLPERDLRLSPHHAVYLDGKLFEAISLVNGMTIFQEEGNGWVSYHHIELDAHDIVLAEGCPCESYLDTGSRHLFGRELFPDFRAPAGAAFCAPLIREGAALAAARQAINTRAARYNKAA